MKALIFTTIMSLGLLSMNVISIRETNEVISESNPEKFEIKIKNDTNDVVKVVNVTSGESYILDKSVVTAIKIEKDDLLYYYKKGKKGALILTTSMDIQEKAKLLSEN